MRIEVPPNLSPRLDFRSEALVAPTPQMWDVMRRAAGSMGMSSLREDPAVRHLERRMAALSGHEDALLLPSVTAATLASFLAMGIRGRKVILERLSHLWWMQDLHFSVFAGAAPVGLLGDEKGRIPLDALQEELDREAYGRSLKTAVVCIENTHNVRGGTVIDPWYTREVASIARTAGAKLLIDGARIFDSAVAQGVAVAELTAPADAVVISMNKALGAPYGAVLCGAEELIAAAGAEAARFGAHQVHKSGFLAAAADFALDGFESRVKATHQLAGRLARGLAEIPGVTVDIESVQTNLVRLDVTALGISQGEFVEGLKRHGVGAKQFMPGVVRFTLHADHDEASIDEAIGIVRAFVLTLGSES